MNSNIAVLCPSCHAKVHAGVIRLERPEEGIYVTVPTQEPRQLTPPATGTAGPSDPHAAVFGQVTEFVVQLPADRRWQLLEELNRRFGP